MGKARRRVVTIKVCGASGLASPKTDAYCALYYKLRGHARIKVGQTTTVRRSDAPEWNNQVFDIVMPPKNLIHAASVTAIVYDKSARRRGEFLGRVRFDGDAIFRRDAAPTAYELEKDPKRPAKSNQRVSGALSLAFSSAMRIVDVADADFDLAAGDMSVTSESSAASEDEEREMEPLALRLFAASGLAKADMLGRADPYVEVYINDSLCATSSVCKNTLNPEWDDRLSVLVPAQGNVKDELRIEVWDRDALGKGSFLGQHLVRGSDVAAEALINAYSERTKVPLTRKIGAASQKHVKKGATLDIRFEPEKRSDADTHVLLLSIVSAKEIAKADILGKSDPYCEVLLNGELVAVTNVVKRTLNPVWGEEFEVHVPAAPTADDELKFVLLDKDIIGSDDFLGQVVLPCKG